MRAVAYLGYKRNTEVELDVLPTEIGISQVKCFECEGTGFWGYGPEGTEGPCVQCKGTGKIYISS